MKVSLMFLCAALSGCGRAPRGAPLVAAALVPERGRSERLLLTGAVEAERATDLITPKTAQWQVQLRWIEAEGTLVKAGQRVAEFDNTAFLNTLNEKRLSAQTARSELAQQRAKSAIDVADRALAVERARTALAKAERQAAIPKDTLSGRAFEEKALERVRARSNLAKAEGELEAQRRSTALDARVWEIGIEKTEREIRSATEAIDDLVLRAPRDGIVTMAENPEEGRKIEVGDSLWVGQPVAQLPDLTRLRVRAQLSDVDEGRVAVGQRASCTLDAYPEQPIPCTITAISPVAREPSRHSLRRTFPVLLALAESDPARLRPGLSVKVAVVLCAAEGAP